MDYTLGSQKYAPAIKNIEQFKKESLYFQEIYDEDDPKKQFSTGPYLHCNTARMFDDKFATPVFIFSDKNKNFSEYLKNILPEWRPDLNKNNREEVIHIVKNVRGIHGTIIKPLRWCHAELALMPTKRSLNVLFFETGEENKKEIKINESK